MTTTPRRTPAALILAAVALLVAACGGTSATTGATTSGGDVSPRPSATGPGIVVAEAGGTSGDAMQVAYIDPFTASTGTPVERVPTADLGKLQAAAKAGTHDVDVAELDSISAVAANALGLTETIDYAKLKPVNPLTPAGQMPYGLGYQEFSTVPSWADKAKALTSFTDFFDPTGFPGRRSIPDYPSFVIPVALVADGVAPEAMYPLDLPRAFKALDRIKGDLVLWKSGAEPVQQLQSGEVDYAIAWSGRVNNQSGVQYTFNQGMLDVAFLTVPKGGTGTDTVYTFLRGVTDVNNQLTAVKIIPYPAPSKDLSAQIPADLASSLPTTPENLSKQFRLDPVWWATNYEKVAAEWEKWKLTL
jgi:putative spermidine/putrescine transport system substrate-binding protein